MTRSTLLHLRIPFSFYLLPVYLFAFSLSHSPDMIPAVIMLVALHVFLYPASNGYNSYFDKDKGSIGGLEKPPAVRQELYHYALLFDVVALVLGSFIHWQVVMAMLIYGLASKAYSHPAIRLKSKPYLGWFIAGFFQGYFTFLMVFMAINGMGLKEVYTMSIQTPAILSSLLLWGSYPMTQVYQHDEDQQRGDITISLKLGVLGTFHFTAVAFALATIGFVCFYLNYYDIYAALAYLLCLSPVLLYFGWWYWQCRQKVHKASYRNTMRLNFISATMMNIYFISFYFLK